MSICKRSWFFGTWTLFPELLCPIWSLLLRDAL